LFTLGVTTFHQDNLHVQISVPQTIIYKEISAVTLSRIAGYDYPDNNTENDVEKMALQSFFSTSQRTALGDVICVSTSGLKNSSVKPVSVLMKNSEVSSRLDKDFLFMYLVKDIVIDEKCRTTSSNDKSNTDYKFTDISSNNTDNSSNKNRITNEFDPSSTDVNSLCSTTNQIDISDEKERMIREVDSGISSSSEITAVTKGENNDDVKCPEMSSVTLYVTSKDLTKIVLKGLSNCRTFDINILTYHYHDLYNAMPLENISQRHDHQENSQGNYLKSLGSQESILAASVGELVEALSPIILLANESLDNHKSNLEGDLRLKPYNNSSKQNSNKNDLSDVQHSMTDSSLYSLITSPLLIECSCGEHGKSLVICKIVIR
jgi:hypothetical protein